MCTALFEWIYYKGSATFTSHAMQWEEPFAAYATAPADVTVPCERSLSDRFCRTCLSTYLDKLKDLLRFSIENSEPRAILRRGTTLSPVRWQPGLRLWPSHIVTRQRLHTGCHGLQRAKLVAPELGSHAHWHLWSHLAGDIKGFSRNLLSNLNVEYNTVRHCRQVHNGLEQKCRQK